VADLLLPARPGQLERLPCNRDHPDVTVGLNEVMAL
jgi:hypothetical protein